MEINKETLDRLDAVLTSPKREEYFKQLYTEIDAMLVCPQCGDGLSYDPDSGNWECYDCYCHDAASKWEYMVDELNDIYESKQERP